MNLGKFLLRTDIFTFTETRVSGSAAMAKWADRKRQGRYQQRGVHISLV